MITGILKMTSGAIASWHRHFEEPIAGKRKMTYVTDTPEYKKT
jgi:hypothetical protein